MIETFLLTEEDIRGQYVEVMGRQVRVDRYGYLLWQKHVWIITYSNFYPHRYEEGRLIPFHRELLGIYKANDWVTFINGNKLDCRIFNLGSKAVDWLLDPHSFINHNISNLVLGYGYTRAKRWLLYNTIKKCVDNVL